MIATRTKENKFNLQITCESTDESAAICIALDDLRKHYQKDLKLVTDSKNPENPDRAGRYANEIAMIDKMLKKMNSPK